MLTLTRPSRTALPKLYAVAFWVVPPEVMLPGAGADALPPADGVGTEDWLAEPLCVGVALPAAPVGGAAGEVVVPVVPGEEPGVVIEPALVPCVVVLPDDVVLLPEGDEVVVEEGAAGCWVLVAPPCEALPLDWLGAGVAAGALCALEGAGWLCVDPDDEPVCATAVPAARATNAIQTRAIMMRLHPQVEMTDLQLAYETGGRARIDRSPGWGPRGGAGAS